MHWFKGFLKDKKNVRIQLLLILGIAIMVNVLAEELIVRFDLTASNRYTLSAASIDIAESLEDPVTVKAYFSEDLPPYLNQVKAELQSFLEEFRAYSGNNLEYQVVNPNASKTSEQKARQAGIRPVMIDVRKRNKIAQRRVYMGAVFKYQGKQQVVPFIRPDGSLEYTIASTVKQLTIDEKPKIGLLQGHGEPSQKMMPQLIQSLKERYQIVSVSGLDSTSVPANIKVLMVISPSGELSQPAIRAIDQYIMAGGHAIFALNRVQAGRWRGRGRAVAQHTGINQLLAAYNVPVKPNLVYDASSSTIRLQQQRGVFSIVNNVRYPYIPSVFNFSEHPISEGLETVRFRFVSSIDTSQVDSTQSIYVLASSSSQSGMAHGMFNLNPRQQWTQQDFNQSHMPLAVAVEGTFKSAFAEVDSVDVPLRQSKKTSMVVIGDGNFIVNGSAQRMQLLPADNINLMVNSIDWLADDTGLMALRTQTVTNRPLQQVSEATKTFLKYLNVFLPILFVLGYGFYRYQRRKGRRRKWIESGI